SLEQMVAASPGKTPISLLQEYGTRLGRTPGYDLLKAEGQAHQPNFTFRVTLGDISCTGGTPDPQGPLGHQGHLCPQPPRFGGDDLAGVGGTWPLGGDLAHLWGGGSTTASGGSSSFLGQLFLFWGQLPPSGDPYLHFGAAYPHLGTLVVQKGWRLPEYTVTQESGPAHRKEFTMTCRVERFVEIG
ncbi:TRBP2 protein, partial [Chloropsis cyanopogon]|nr:TRBP2 protein [Chloropsis cyanopogon]